MYSIFYRNNNWIFTDQCVKIIFQNFLFSINAISSIDKQLNFELLISCIAYQIKITSIT